MQKDLTPTPHIEAKKGQIAETVLMPGDPKRSAFCARAYLQDAVLVNDVRGVQGYTGRYHGQRVTVMASGMGIPAMGLYAHELFAFYDVRRIIRIGTAGALQPELPLRSLVLGQGACTDSNFAAQYQLPGSFAPLADFGLLQAAAAEAEKRGLHYQVGNLLSADCFYDDSARQNLWQKMGVLAVEMETAALYCEAARQHRQALTICTVSDSLVTGEVTDAAEREQGFTKMMELALALA